MCFLRMSLALFLLALCNLPANAHAAERYLFVGTTFPYILEEGETLKPEGVGVDLLNRISEITGDQFDIRVLPWSRAIELVKQGHASGLIGPYLSTERAQYLDYAPIPFYKDRMVFVSRTHDHIDWQGDFDRLKPYEILLIKNWFYGKEFEEARAGLKIYDTVSQEGALNMLMRNRVDLVALNERNAKHLIKEKKMTASVHINTPHIAINHGYFAYSKALNDQALQKRMNNALQTLYSNGEIKEINARFGLSYDAD